MLRESQRRLLTELRNALVPLHRTLLEWERAAYERIHGRTGAAELLKAIVKRGNVYISNAVLGGRFCLRACIVNHRTNDEDIGRVVPEVLDVARDLLSPTQ